MLRVPVKILRKIVRPAHRQFAISQQGALLDQRHGVQFVAAVDFLDGSHDRLRARVSVRQLPHRRALAADRAATASPPVPPSPAAASIGKLGFVLHVYDRETTVGGSVHQLRTVVVVDDRRDVDLAQPSRRPRERGPMVRPARVDRVDEHQLTLPIHEEWQLRPFVRPHHHVFVRRHREMTLGARPGPRETTERPEAG
jgi:hypothetical protein